MHACKPEGQDLCILLDLSYLSVGERLASFARHTFNLPSRKPVAPSNTAYCTDDARRAHIIPPKQLRSEPTDCLRANERSLSSIISQSAAATTAATAFVGLWQQPTSARLRSRILALVAAHSQ